MGRDLYQKQRAPDVAVAFDAPPMELAGRQRFSRGSARAPPGFNLLHGNLDEFAASRYSYIETNELGLLFRAPAVFVRPCTARIARLKRGAQEAAR